MRVKNQSGVVYKIQCKSGIVQVTLARCLHKRIGNNVNSVRNNKLEASALAKHAIEKNHFFDFQKQNIRIFENDLKN